MKKSALQSKTIWVNLLVLGAGIIGYVQGHEVIQDYPQAMAIMAAAVGALNLVLRFVTNKPIR